MNEIDLKGRVTFIEVIQIVKLLAELWQSITDDQKAIVLEIIQKFKN